MKSRFATCLNCIDGRVQMPVIDWITQNYDVDYVDMITETGMDEFLANENCDQYHVMRKLGISIGHHNSDSIFIVGHFDCVEKSAGEKTHKKQIRQAVERIKNYTLSCNVIGLWVSEDLQVQKICENKGPVFI